jgi:catalase
MIDLPVFPFKDPQALYDNLVASQRDPTHQPDPAAAFLASHPETARALAIIEPCAVVGFDNTAYYSLNAFRFVNADGASPMRWTSRPCSRMRPGPGQARTNFFRWADREHPAAPLQWHSPDGER